MSETDLEQRVAEQLEPIMRNLLGRVESPMTEQDHEAIADGLNEAARLGLRVMWASVLAGAAEVGADISSFDVERLRAQDPPVR